MPFKRFQTLQQIGNSNIEYIGLCLSGWKIEKKQVKNFAKSYKFLVFSIEFKEFLC